MSSIHISILYTLLTIIFADNRTFFFTKSNYDLWCQENLLSNSVFLYPDRTPIGIYRTATIKSVTYDLLDDENNGLFQIKTRRLADFYFLIINITRPFDINREYQDVYTLRIQAKIITTHENQTEQAELRLHVADSNDNDGVFDMDIYEQNYTHSMPIEQSLLRLHASDADEIQHAQILYELASSLNETFSLHPFTGELYLISKANLQLSYEFDVYAYDRYRKRLVDNNMKTKTQVKLYFNRANLLPKKWQSIQTIFNQTIEFQEIISSFEIDISERKSINLLNIHQPILTIALKPTERSFEVFLLRNSSSNAVNFFLEQNNIYLNRYLIDEYHLQLLVCVNNRSQCQPTVYRFLPSIDFNSYQFHFQNQKTIHLDENLPVDSFVTRIELQYHNLYDQQSLNINYKLMNDEKDFQFYIHPKTGILRLAERLEYRPYLLDIQANIQLFNRRYSIDTTVAIDVREINKHRPIFHNNTPTEFFQLPYQFQAIDLDQNKQTNGRITYRLWNCDERCPFQIDPDNGTLTVRNQRDFIPEKIYHLQIIAFDWGEPTSLESIMTIQVNLPSRLRKRDLGRTRAYSRRWRKKSTVFPTTTTNSAMETDRNLYTTVSPSNGDTVYLNVGFRRNSTSYQLSEGAEPGTVIDQLKIEYDAFPLNINAETDNLFFYTINDTSVPFIIDQDRRLLKLIDRIDREKQSRYVFEIELKFKSIYAMKLQELYRCEKGYPTSMNFQYTKAFFQRMLVIIVVEDVNDNIPRCHTFHTAIQLKENQLEKNIFQVQAFDPDLGENGTVSYSLLDYQSYFIINPSTGQIDCIKSLDREEIPFLHLHIIASDQGLQPQLQSICTTVHIQISDVNDNTPQFSSNNYTFNLFSDMPRYSIFGQVYAIDADPNDQLIYSLHPNPYVIINKYTGYLRLKHNLHRLIDQPFNVTVEVSDGVHRNRTSINIHTEAFPDAQEPILLAEPAYGLNINESLAVGSMITNIYRRLQLDPSSIDFIEIIHDETELPFSIDQQGYLRLTHSLIGSSKSSYWLSIRLSRYRAHPPHTFVHVHLSIRQENFYLPQCVDIYQSVKVYDYSIQHPFARIEAISLNKHSLLRYAILDKDRTDKLFAIDPRTGSVQLLPSVQNNRRYKSDYLLTVQAQDSQHKLSVDCYLKIHLIRRRQLIPKFLSAPLYQVDLPEIDRHSGRLRQRLFQIVALLDSQVYDQKLEIRYRIVHFNEHFIINRQTGYIAAKQPLNAYTTFEFNVEAFTVAHRDDILSDGNENEDDEQPNRGKWRIVSSRVMLPVKIRILPMIARNRSVSASIDSTINIDLLLTTEVGSTILHLGRNNPLNDTQWFILIGHIRQTRYFHVDFQTGQLILLRPIDELINQTNTIELRINITNDWITMNIIKVIIRLVDNRIPSIEFAQNDYYSSVSKNIPIGAEIARLTIANPSDDCVYSIDTVERIKSKDLFRINPYSGSVTVNESLEDSASHSHLLTILYRCEHNSFIAHTALHVNILDDKNLFNQTTNSWRFGREKYLIIFESSLVKYRRKYLMDLELISNGNEKKRVKPKAEILQGDPLGLFTIDPTKQSLILLDESLVRSYVYPISLIIVDTSQTEPINCTVTLFVSNIGIYFPCPLYVQTSPYLFTYESVPSKSIDVLTGQEYEPYHSLTVRAFDPFTPLNGEASNMAECILYSQPDHSADFPIRNLDFIFDNEDFFGYVNDSFGLLSYIYNDRQEPVQITLKKSFNLTHPYDITYHLVNQTHIHLFQLDEYAGLLKTTAKDDSLTKYSLLVYAQYKAFVTFTRLNLMVHHQVPLIEHPLPSIYEFKLYAPFVNNSTIGYLNQTRKKFTILNDQVPSMIAIDNQSGRLFVRNRSLILTNGNFYDFLIQDEHLQITRIQIVVLNSVEPLSECRFNRLTDRQLLGFIDVISNESICYQTIQRSFHLYNYNHLLILDRQHGLLRYRNENQTINEDLLLLIQIDQSKCLVTIEKLNSQVSYLMIRNGSEMQNQYHLDKSSGRVKLANGTSLIYDIVPFQSPIFSQTSYQFFLNLSNSTDEPKIVGRVSAQPYDSTRSHLVYQFLHRNDHFHLHPDSGRISFMSTEYFNQTLEQLQVIARDLIYQVNTTVNITIDIVKPNGISYSSPIYSRTISEVLPPGSIVFQSNLSTTDQLHYSLERSKADLFQIDPLTGQVRLRDYLTEQFYSFEIHTSPVDQTSIVKLIVKDYNNHPPNFINLPLNLSGSTSESFLTKLSANDLDLDDNKHLRYYLLDEDQQKIFSINQSNGIITLNRQSSFNRSLVQLYIGVSDGLYLTKSYLQLSLYNYSQHSPRFSSKEYFFQYNQSIGSLGQIFATDADLNDQILYELYLQPDGIEIDPYSGQLTITKNLFAKPMIEFFGSAIDLAKQIVYTRIQLSYSIEPTFNSNMYFISLIPSKLLIPSEIFQFTLVDSFNQPLNSVRYQLANQTNLFEIRGNQLIIKEYLIASTIFHLNVNAYWKDFILQTSVQVIFVEQFIQLDQSFYEFTLERDSLKDNLLVKTFSIENFTLKIVPTPLTRNHCLENFYIKQNELYFRHSTVLSDLCFFELHLIDNTTISSSQVKVTLIDSNTPPKFSSDTYHFHFTTADHRFRVFATQNSPSIHYQLQNNPYGVTIDQTNGRLIFQYGLDLIHNLDRIQLSVYAIDPKTNLNDTALVRITFNQQKQFTIPERSSEIVVCPNVPISLSDQSLPGTVIQDISNTTNTQISYMYYILSGDTYGLFAVNNLGQLYLTSSILNQTSEADFQLFILLSSSSSSLSFCRTNISIVRTPKWSRFICPPMPIQWMIEEDSPIGTIIGTVKERLLLLNDNSSQLIDQIHLKLNPNDQDAQSFLLNSQTGVITSNSGLDYERKHSYTFSILLQPAELNCSLTVAIKLININDNPITWNLTSLVYNVTENNLVPFYVGRIELIDIDQLFTSNYEFSLRNSSSQISIDPTTGSIILQEKLDREYHGSELHYQISAIDTNNKGNHLTNNLTLHIIDVNDNGPKFLQDFYSVNISKSIRPDTNVFQANATSDDPIANGNFTYSLRNASEYFGIEKTTGIVRLRRSLPSTLKNFTLEIEVLEDGINLTARTNLLLSIVNDDNIYFDLVKKNDCFLEENQPIGTRICTIGKNEEDFIYEMIDPMENFAILEKNGTIINRKVFDYEHDKHEYNVTILVRDRDNQSILLSSLNLTIFLRNINDNTPQFQTKNFTTLVYFYYPSIDTVIHQILVTDNDQSNLTFEILNDTISSYRYHPFSNGIDLILVKPIVRDREDHLIIRVWDDKTSSVDLHLRLLYLERQVSRPQILSQTIDGYIDFEEKSPQINLGQLFVKNQTDYQFVHYNLFDNEHFSLKQISNSQTELYFKTFNQSSQEQQKHRLLQFQIQLTAVAVKESVPKIDLTNPVVIYLSSTINSSLTPHSVDINLWSIDREMLDRTLAMLININPQSTNEQFLTQSLPSIRENLAQIIGVSVRHVHIYAFDLKDPHQIELLIVIIRYPSRLRPSRYIHKKLLYNALKNSTTLLTRIVHVDSIAKISITQCHSKTCENSGRCTSHIKLLNDQYDYFSSKSYQRLIPKYQWNIKCLCLNYFYGQRCQFKQDYQSPCSSNPCSSTERCIEESSTLYTCQCIDEPCNSNEILSEESLDCININSPTCRDSSNTLTFDGYSFVRLNVTWNLTQHLNISWTFRTQVAQGKLIQMTFVDEKKKQHSLTIQVIDSHLNFQLNQNVLLEINEITVNDGLWHSVYFSIDYTANNYNSYYLLRLDHVFSRRIHLTQPISSNRLKDFLIGTDFHGCLGNLTLNNQTIHLQKQQKNYFLEHIGTNDGCQLAEVETRTLRQYTSKEDLCSLYHPCYNGGVCSSTSNKHGLSFVCNCLKPRFAGRQCQRDLQPCESQPCLFDERCISSSNTSYSCISSLVALPMSSKNPLYLGLIVTFSTVILFVLLLLSLIVYCQQQRKDKQRKVSLSHEKPSVSAPLLIQKSSPTANNIESPIQTLLKLNHQGKQTIETTALVDNNQLQANMNNFNDKRSNNQLNKSSHSIDKQAYQSHESIDHRQSDPKYYSTIGRMNIPPDNFLVHYNSIDYDSTRVPLVDSQATDLFDFPASPTRYFNGHNDENSNNYQIRINSLSNFPEKLPEQTDMELTHSSNDSSTNNEQSLLTSPRKRSLFNGGSTHSIRASSSSLQKAPVYAKVIKTSSKVTNGGMSTIERLRLSGSPLRLLSSSPTYTRTTSFLKSTTHSDDDTLQTSSTPVKTSKIINPTSWKLNPRKLDSLKARRNSRQTDDDDDDNNHHDTHTNHETSQLTMRTTTSTRLRHASDSDLTKEHVNGKKSTKLSSFFQTEV